MPTSDFTILNAALTRTGNPPISSLSDGSPGADIAASNYEIVVEAHLSAHPWKRASKIEQLARLDNEEDGEPPEPWSAAYQLPEDLTEIRTVKVSGLVIDYEVHGDTILCDAAEDDLVILHYVWRAAEADWPAWFREGITRRMEAIFLRGIGERYAEAKARDGEADDWFRLAKHRDSQSQTAREPMRSTTLEARRGSPAASAISRV